MCRDLRAVWRASCVACARVWRASCVACELCGVCRASCVACAVREPSGKVMEADSVPPFQWFVCFASEYVLVVFGVQR